MGVELLLHVGPPQRLTPVRRRQLQHATARPAGQQAEPVSQVAPRLNAVQLAAGQQRHEGRVDLAGVVVAYELPASNASCVQ